ncbi:MAG: hypothetical protein DCF30_08940 [Hyphomicrobiales bacterium]|nr:MAG: hypothetical protein DCF30_08940 [Hyphomicrobiales bacterium]
MSRPVSLLFAAGMICAAGPSLAAIDCVGTLTGEWATKGEFDMGFVKVKVENHDSFNPDGSFKAVRRFVNQEGKWEQQDSSGKWSAKPGARQTECVVEMASSSEFGTASSRTTVTVLNKDRFRWMGMDVKRVK